MDRIDIKISFECNNLCEFCVQGDKRYRLKPKKISEIKKELSKAAEEGIRGVVFTGGEPTIHKNILEAVEFAKNNGFKVIQIQSNGRMFAYFDFCRKIIAAGANEFSPALHSSKKEIHDALTKSPGAWDQVVKGINNLKKLDQYVLTNTVVTTKNYKDLPELAKLFVKLDVDQFQFAFVHVIGTAWKNKDWLVPKKSDAMPFIKKGLDIGIGAGKRVMTEAIPYCLMQGYEEYIAEKNIPKTKVVAENVLDDYDFFRKNEGKVKRDECKKCIYFEICEGPWKEYPQIYGWDEFEPVVKKGDKFEETNFDNEIIKTLMDNYELGEFCKAFKYIGHSCNNVHLLEFKNKSVIFKIGRYNEDDIKRELNFISEFDFFPGIINTVNGKSFIGYGDKKIKLYEYIIGEFLCLEENLPVIFDFIKKVNQNMKEKMVYHNLQLIKKDNNIYFLESEHLGEEIYEKDMTVAKYIFDILEKSKDFPDKKIDLLLMGEVFASEFKIDKANVFAKLKKELDEKVGNQKLNYYKNILNES